MADGVLSEEEVAAVAEALITAADGEAVTAEAIAEAGLEYSDLPPETPVEVRQDENGNEVIITAEVAAALQVLESPSELIGAIFSDPGEVLLAALGSIGADMSVEEREEAEKMVVATVVAAGAAMNAAAVAASAAAGAATSAATTTTGSSTGGTSPNNGGTGGGPAAGNDKPKRTFRRRIK
jgi:hypothetical protein